MSLSKGGSDLSQGADDGIAGGMSIIEMAYMHTDSHNITFSGQVLCSV